MTVQKTPEGTPAGGTTPPPAADPGKDSAGKPAADPAATNPPAADPATPAGASGDSAAATAANGKPAEGAKTEPPAGGPAVVPDKYELKIPDGSLLDAAHVDKLTAFAKEQKLTNAQAQVILNRENEAVASYVTAHKPGGEVWNKLVTDWESAALVDKEIGGSKEVLAANVELGKRVIDRYFPEPIRKFLQESGYGSNPDVLRGFVKLGKAAGEDKIERPNTTPTDQKSTAELFYGNPATP